MVQFLYHREYSLLALYGNKLLFFERITWNTNVQRVGKMRVPLFKPEL
jgi:hypothetical protein